MHLQPRRRTSACHVMLDELGVWCWWQSLRGCFHLVLTSTWSYHNKGRTYQTHSDKYGMVWKHFFDGENTCIVWVTYPALQNYSPPIELFHILSQYIHKLKYILFGFHVTYKRNTAAIMMSTGNQTDVGHRKCVYHTHQPTVRLWLRG